MKVLIAYYSRTGHTEKLAKAIKKELESRGHLVDVEKVKPVKERSFWKWFFIRIFKGECDILPPKIKDVSKYDLILIGTPNWTRLSLPMARYLKTITGLKYKNVGLFSTTTLWPSFEWYLLSAYLLDLTFTKIIEEKEGKVIDSILLSSIFKNKNYSSKYGREKIKKFCDKVTTQPPSFTEFFLIQKEIDIIRSLVILFINLLVIFSIFEFVSVIFSSQILTWMQFLFLFLIFFLTIFFLIRLLEEKKNIFLGKYLAGISLILTSTLANFFIQPYFSHLIIFGYFLTIVFFALFRDHWVVLSIGLLSVLGYIFLFFSYQNKEIFHPYLDLFFLFAGIGIVSFITYSLRKHFLLLLEAQEELSETASVLEIKVKARTRELQELVESLDEKVKERTKELEQKISELERFQRLAVGRELKMIKLKEEIKKLKEELNKKVD